MTEYNWEKELKAFDDTKAGVKGLVDSGISKVPRIFMNNHLENDEKPTSGDCQFNIPFIDFKDFDKDSVSRNEIISKVRDACEKWGFFQIVNHGIPLSIMDDMRKGVQGFHEQDTEVKKQFYSRDYTKKIVFNSNRDLFQAPPANWRDGFICTMGPPQPDPQELPAVCRDILIEYKNYVQKLALTLFEVLSEGLALKCSFMNEMDCAERLFIVGHYYPACPEPELTIGTTSHTDSAFLTILLQDQIGGLQVLHDNHWIDVPYLPGALVINVGDLLQLITNDKFKSVHHRVLAKKVGPRISIASFFRNHVAEGIKPKVYGPIKELLSDENPAKYKDTCIKEYLTHRNKNGLDGSDPLAPFKL